MSEKISESERKKLREDAKKELERLEKIYADDKKTELINRYKNKFNICESTYKVVLKTHQLKTKGEIKGFLKLDMRQVPHALSFAGYSIDRDLLNRLFGKNSKKGERSAKVLRDLVTHGVDESAVDEIASRELKLYRDMDSFLDIIRKSY